MMEQLEEAISQPTPVKKALLSFCHAYAVDTKELEQALAHDSWELLEPCIRKQFQIADRSVVGQGVETERRQWTKAVEVRVLGHAHSAPVRAGVWRQAPPSKGTLIVSLSIELCDISTDAIIALAQSLGDRDARLPLLGAQVTVSVDRTAKPSLRSVLEVCASELVPGLSAPNRHPFPFRISELVSAAETSRRNRSPSDGEQDCRGLYGVLTGDEGWRYVPAVRAREIIEKGWGSRYFIWVVGFGDSAVLLNDKPQVYKDAESEFFTSWLGRPTDYFKTDYTVPGLDHGVLYAVESIAQLAVQLDDVTKDMEEQLRAESERRLAVTPREIFSGKLRSRRIRLLSIVASIAKNRIAELASMYSVLENEMGLTRRLEQAKENVAMLDNWRNELATARRWAVAVSATLTGAVLAVVARIIIA